VSFCNSPKKSAHRLLCVRFESDHLAADIAKRTAETSTKDVGALLALSYLLDDM
jgi:hypothetical protein